MVKLLLLPENLNEKDKKGQTPLHYGVKSGNLDIVKLLVSSGADKNAKDKTGKSPLDLARKNLKSTFSKVFQTTKVIPLKKSLPNTKTQPSGEENFSLEEDTDEDKENNIEDTEE